MQDNVLQTPAPGKVGLPINKVLLYLAKILWQLPNERIDDLRLPSKNMVILLIHSIPGSLVVAVANKQSRQLFPRNLRRLDLYSGKAYNTVSLSNEGVLLSGFIGQVFLY